MKCLFQLSQVKIELGAKKVNRVKAVLDNDKRNNFNLKASLALASLHYKIN
jgi:hypothetical protein